jgi:hypothetical protein
MDLPVACTLSPEALAARRQGLLTELMRSATAREELGDGVRLTFAASDETLTSVFTAISAERKCCEFLRFRVTVEPGGGPVALELTGPRGTREFLEALGLTQS